MRKGSILLFICIAFMLAALVAKAQVKSKSFSYVLKRLLSHNVPELPVTAVASSPANYILLDARESDEYKVSHLRNAIHIGYNEFHPEALKGIAKDKPIVVYCSIGKRSENIAQRLMKQGYTKVSNLYGGIFEWVNEGHVVYDMQGKPTVNVQAYNGLWGRFLEEGNKVYQ